MKIVLFDADGVLTVPEELFATTYAYQIGVSADDFTAFFKGPFQEAIIGRADLKDLIEKHNDLWNWHGDVEELLKRWFEAENVRNEPLLKLAKNLRADGIPCFVATNQEKYRGTYLEEKMFAGEFDGFYISSSLGVKKPDPEYFKIILADLAGKYGAINPEDVIFIDDTPKHVEAARSIGISAFIYENAKDAKEKIKKQLG